MFNLINSQVYELQQQQESLLLLENKQQQQQQQQQQNNCQNKRRNSNNKKNSNNNNNNSNGNYSSGNEGVNNYCSNSNSNYNNNSSSNNTGAYNYKSLNNLTNFINNNNSNNNSNSRKKKSNYGSYYRQEKLKATANFIEKFLKNEVNNSSASAAIATTPTATINSSKSQLNEEYNNNNNKQNGVNNNSNNINNFTYSYHTYNDCPTSDTSCNKDSSMMLRHQRIYNIGGETTAAHSDKIKLHNGGGGGGGGGGENYHQEYDDLNYDEMTKRLHGGGGGSIEDDNRSDITELGPNSLQIEHYNNLLDKNSSDTMPSLSPSQSSTDQSSSTTTTTASTTISSNSNNSNNSSSSINGRASSSSSSSSATKTTTTTTTNNDEMTGKIKKKSNNNSQTTTSSSSSSSSASSSSTVLHRKKLLQVVTFLDQRNQRLEKELQNEKTRRNEELSRIVKSLLYFEAKLKSEKKVINQKLYEKDDEIARLVKLNRSLREKLNCNNNNIKNDDASNMTTEEDTITTLENNMDDQLLESKYPESLYCTNCRKEFYGLNEKCDISTQTSGKLTDNRSNNNCKGENNNSNNSNHQNNSNSTEHCSSSDETLSSSFYGARRSVRYTSKRTFGTFREYMRSRCMNIDDPSIENHNLSEDENRSTLSRDEFPSQKSSLKKDKLFSSAIERLHGVRRVSSFEFDSSEAENRSHRKHFSSSGPETDHEHTNSPNDEGIEDDDEDDFDEEDENYDEEIEMARKNDFGSGNFGVLNSGNSKEFSETSVKQDFEVSTDDWYASASDADDDQNSSVCRTKSYGYNAVNPVLECVNQILLQQSMEECANDKFSAAENHYDNSCNGPMSLESNDNNIGGFSSSICSNVSGKDNHSGPGNSSNTGSRKRVHFSTKNSMVHVPRDDDDITEQKSCSFSDALNSSIASEHHSNNLNYESIYSNEYEPIGSEHNSSNLYVDMESKLDQDERLNLKSKHSQHHQSQSQSKQPPALPPKPANLIKFKRATKINPVPPPHRHSIDAIPIQSLPATTKLTKELLEKVDCDKNDKFGSEPDYCSISEVNVAIKTMQIVAEVHKSNDANSVSSAASVSADNSDAMSQKTSDDAEEIFADIPKLPNVAAIIAPSKSKSINKLHTKTAAKLKIDSHSNFIQAEPHPTSLQIQQKQQVQQQQQQQQQQRPQSLQLYRPKSPGQVQRKHVPNILAEINKKIQQANIATAALSPANSSKLNSNFIMPISPTKRTKQTHQLLPILKSPSSSSSTAAGNIVHSKNFNNLLLSTQNLNSTSSVTASTCKAVKSIDLIKLNQQKSPSLKQQQQQQQQLQHKQKNQFQSNMENSKNNSMKVAQHHLHDIKQTIIEDSLPLEAEFDWYNLDAEYGKSTNRPDIVKAADVLNGCLDEYILANSGSGVVTLHRDRITNDINQSVEYNLDEEFSLSNQPDIIKENIRAVEEKRLEPIPGSDPESNNSSPKKDNNSNCESKENSDRSELESEQKKDSTESAVVETVLKTDDEEIINSTDISKNMASKDSAATTIVNKFPTICDQTPCRQSVVNLKQKKFIEFIDNAGLSTKPLPQQRKIYFTGPFV